MEQKGVSGYASTLLPRMEVDALRPEGAWAAAFQNGVWTIPNFSSPSDLCAFIKQFLEEKKAQDVVTINLVGKSLIADYLVIASGTSARQLISISQELQDRLKKGGLPARVEGLDQADWLLVDASSVIVHLFKPEARLSYNLEAMWGLTLPVALGPDMQVTHAV